jgi:hypothetical protein
MKIASKTKAREVTGAHIDCSEATRRRWEAVERAGHVRRLGGARSPKLGTRTMVAGDSGEIGLVQVDQEMRKGEANVMTR